jgi:hypothetical protein
VKPGTVEKKVAAVKPLDKPPTEAERLEHERAGHVPVRSWCSTCAEMIGRTPKHNPVRKRRPGGILSLDLMGPFEQGYAPVPGSEGKKVMTYALVGAFLPPNSEELEARGLLETQTRKEAYRAANAMARKELPAVTAETPLTHFEEGETAPPIEEWSYAGRDLDFALYFVEFVTSKNQPELLLAIQKMVAQVESHWHGTRVIWRIHGDRAVEITGPLVTEWAATRGCIVTRTVAQNPQSNGIAERAVAWLKHRTRLLLHQAKSRVSTMYWPYAMLRAAAHHRCWQYGLKTAQIPFGRRVSVQEKWRDPTGSMAHAWV